MHYIIQHLSNALLCSTEHLTSRINNRNEKSMGRLRNVTHKTLTSSKRIMKLAHKTKIPSLAIYKQGQTLLCYWSSWEVLTSQNLPTITVSININLFQKCKATYKYNVKYITHSHMRSDSYDCTIANRKYLKRANPKAIKICLTDQLHFVSISMDMTS
jgi:hypothetical protein